MKRIIQFHHVIVWVKSFLFLVCLVSTIALSTVSGQVHQQDLEGIDVVSETERVAKNGAIVVALERANWIYRLGERAVFTIEADKEIVKDGHVHYTIGPEKMTPTQTGTVMLKEGRAIIVANGMREPGFLRCEVSLSSAGEKHSATATAAYAPYDIQPTGTTLHDFNTYWAEAIQRSKSVPLHTKKVFLPKRITDQVDAYQVEYQFYNDGVVSFFGVLSVPKKQGSYRAIVRFPGAGWTPLAGDQTNAAKGYITLDLYIHGHPVTEDRSYYEALRSNELKDYMYKGIAHRDSFYYKNVILGCVRSIDLLHSLPNFNGRIGAWGSSQGGALSIITTSLEPRINCFVALCPAMCDFAGYTHGRAGGWPHFFTTRVSDKQVQEQALKTLAYYDVVNFSKEIRVPGYFSWGFNDKTTPPTSFYSAFNTIDAPKRLYVIPDGEHKIYPEQRKQTYDWLMKRLAEE